MKTLDCEEGIILYVGKIRYVIPQTDRLCLHSHVKGKGAYSVVPVSLSLALRKS